jgi:xylulokinase
MENQYLLGIDIGSYESKGVITTPEGKVIASAAIGHVMNFPKPGWAEQDADQVWWHDFVYLCRELLAQSGIDPRQILAIGPSGTSQCVLPLDQAGKPLRPAILYGVDTRAAQETQEIEDQFGADAIFKHCGHRLLPQDLGPRMLWLKHNEPDVYARTATVLTESAYLVYRLTGEKIIDIYTAYDSGPMFDIYQMKYRPEFTLPLMPMEILPRPAWTVEVVGGVTLQAAAETGLAAGTPVIAGTSDAAAEALSAGLSLPGDLMIMYGSSAFFIMKTDRLVVDECLWGDTFLEKDTYAVAAGMAVGGSITRWFRDQFGQPEWDAEKAGGPNAYAALAELAAHPPPGANGLMVLPYFSGERTPFYDANARGVIAGLSLKHTRADIYRAILESIGFGIRHNIEAMIAAGLVPQRCLAVGGGTKNPLWLQMVSDIAGIDQYVPDQHYGACYGDAFLAGVGAGLFRDTSEIDRWIHHRQVIHPDPHAQQIYESYYQVYRQLYQDTAQSIHRLVSLSEGPA